MRANMSDDCIVGAFDEFISNEMRQGLGSLIDEYRDVWRCLAVTSSVKEELL